MANAINRNMQMVNVVQESIDRMITTRKKDCKNFAGNLQDLEDIAQGQTLPTDLMIQGDKIFSDAGWKTGKGPGTKATISTGIGIFYHLHRQSFEEKIFIQASTSSMAPSPLYAEALGLLLASQIAIKLKAQKFTFLTDNLTLAKDAAAKTISEKQVPWELRKQIARRPQKIWKQKFFILKEITMAWLMIVLNRLLDKTSLCLSPNVLIHLI